MCDAASSGFLGATRPPAPGATPKMRRAKLVSRPLLVICLVVFCSSLPYVLINYRTFRKVQRYVHIGEWYRSKASGTHSEGSLHYQLRDQKLETQGTLQRATGQGTYVTGGIRGSDFNSYSYKAFSKNAALVATARPRPYPVHNGSMTSPDVLANIDGADALQQVQNERKKLIADVCEKHRYEIGGNFLYKDTFRHIYVIDDQKLLFCYIPKVGCSNWKRVLMVLDGKRDVTNDITSREAHAHNGMTVLGKLTKEEQEYRLKNYRKAMFVREPLSRVVSAYKNKFGDLNVYRAAPRVFHNYAKHIVSRYRNSPSDVAKTTGENVTWAEFVKYLTNTNERPGFDRHWKEMYKLCSPCQINYDFVGKLENTGTEANFVLKSLNLTRDVKFPGRENSHPTNVSTTTTKYFHDFSTKTLSALWDIYKTDFELFGYDKPSYIK